MLWIYCWYKADGIDNNFYYYFLQTKQSNHNKFIVKMSQIQYSRAREPLGSRVNIDFTPKKSSCSWTDQRIEEIKKKYDSTSKKITQPEFKVRVKTQYHDKQNNHKTYKTQYDQYSPHNSTNNANHHDIYSRSKTSECFNWAATTSQNQSFISPQGSTVKTKVQESDVDLQGSIAYQHKLASQNDKTYKPSSIRLMTEYSTFTRHRDPISKLNRREAYDSRMQNIDKINSKIKQILDSINNCQQQSKFAQIQLSRNRQIQQSYLGRSIISNNDIKGEQGNNEFQETKILQKRKIYYQSDHSAELSQPLPKEIKREIIFPEYNGVKNNHFEQYISTYTNKLKQQEKQIQSRKSFIKDREIMRSSSCFSRIKKDSMSNNRKSILRDDDIEHIDKQITRFHKKIEALEEQKRKMNIEFKPFDFDYSPGKKGYRDYTPDSFKKIKNSDKLRQEPTRSLYLNQLNPKSSKTIKDENSSHQKSKTACYFYPKQQISSFTNELQKSLEKKPSQQQNNIKESIIHQEGLGKEEEIYDNWQLRKNVGERMQERRKLLQEYQKGKILGNRERKETQRLIQALCKQVTLDEELRNSKNWFAQSHSSCKINLLRQQMLKKGISMTMDQIQRQFNTINDDQNDPFFSFREEKYTISSVAEHYAEANRYWHENIVHSWNFSQLLEQQHFAQKFINKKDIAIEDLVRLLNTQTGNFYRNRDIYLIFERIKKQLKVQNHQNITIQQLKAVLGK